jgi:ferrous iron transport protein A
MCSALLRPLVTSLADLENRRPAVVTAVRAGDANTPSERARELADIGFVPGEAVMVMTRGWPGGDPLVVRVGLSTFALRRSEAACVEVAPT